VAAVGLPHERLGEEVAVVVHLHEGAAITEEEIIDFAKERLATYKVPARVYISEQALPRNATNKVLKREIKEALLGA
jgi:long-chain acyl-CoA synthetase